jgi:hypothetical protein
MRLAFDLVGGRIFVPWITFNLTPREFHLLDTQDYVGKLILLSARTKGSRLGDGVSLTSGSYLNDLSGALQIQCRKERQTREWERKYCTSYRTSRARLVRYTGNPERFTLRRFQD